MDKKHYRRWNWESDQPEGPLENDAPFPRSYATVHSDYWGRVFRVEVVNPNDFQFESDNDDAVEEKYIYDYFFDDSGQILEKRSLDVDGTVCLIVRFEYERDGRVVREIAWSPGQSIPSCVNHRTD